MKTGQSVKSVIVKTVRHFHASPEAVFDAWLNPGQAGKFLFATPDGRMKRVDIEPRIGGVFNITEQRGDKDFEHIGNYLEIARPYRLAFTFATQHFPATLVTIDIMPLEHSCELVLTHDGISPEYADRIQDGWHDILDGLAEVLNEP